MATNIPPHNLDELIEGCLALIANPDLPDDDLVKLIPGPDFPTGGVIVEPAESIRSAYATGRGAFRLRARWAVEDLGRGQWQVVVTEIPFQVPEIPADREAGRGDPDPQGAASGRYSRRIRR